MIPEEYKTILEELDWTDFNKVFQAQAIAADDVTLTNLYVEASAKAIEELSSGVGKREK